MALTIHLPTGAKVKRVELYLHSPSGPSLTVIGRILPCLHFLSFKFSSRKEYSRFFWTVRITILTYRDWNHIRIQEIIAIWMQIYTLYYIFIHVWITITEYTLIIILILQALINIYVVYIKLTAMSYTCISYALQWRCTLVFTCTFSLVLCYPWWWFR